MWSDPRRILMGEPKRFPENLGVTQKRIEADSQGFWPQASREMEQPPSTDEDGNVGCERQDGGHTTGGWLSGQAAAGHASPERPASSSLWEREERGANCGRRGEAWEVEGNREERGSS